IGGFGPPMKQPRKQIVGAAAACRIQWRQIVVTHPVNVGATVEKICRRLLLSAMARTPEGVSDLVRRCIRWSRRTGRPRGYLRASSDERGDDRSAVGIVTRPIGRHVKEGP